jgi:hypothetical protein
MNLAMGSWEITPWEKSDSSTHMGALLAQFHQENIFITSHGGGGGDMDLTLVRILRIISVFLLQSASTFKNTIVYTHGGTFFKSLLLPLRAERSHTQGVRGGGYAGGGGGHFWGMGVLSKRGVFQP